MGTRGAIGFIKNGVEKVTYNHFDSYPSGVGIAVAGYCRRTTIKAMNKAFDKLVLVTEEASPTKEQQKQLNKYLSTSVSSGKPEEWYALLRETQGDLVEIVNCGFMIDSKEFLLDSLFCEYAYIINLDTNMLEVYKGSQKDPDKGAGRYVGQKAENGREYFGVSLVKEIPLKAKDIADQVLSVGREEDEE